MKFYLYSEELKKRILHITLYLEGGRVLGNVGSSRLASIFGNVVGGNEVSEDVTTADHFSNEEPEDDLEGNGGVNHRFLKGEVLVLAGLDGADNLGKVSLDGGPLSLGGRSHLLLEDSLKKLCATGPLGGLSSVENAGHVGDLLEHVHLASGHGCYL
ncbi:hypothetical protein PFISCL1PPCAC_28809, partial [Pristionchus fissidentatus]